MLAEAWGDYWHYRQKLLTEFVRERR